MTEVLLAEGLRLVGIVIRGDAGRGLHCKNKKITLTQIGLSQLQLYNA